MELLQRQTSAGPSSLLKGGITLKNSLKALLLGLLAIGVVGAISGIAIGVSRNWGQTSSSEAPSSSDGNSDPSSSSESPSSGDSSSGGSISSASPSGGEIQDGAYIDCDITSINLTMSSSSTDYPEASFTATIHNADLTINELAGTHLGIVFQDVAINDYFDFYMISSTGNWYKDHSDGSHVITSGSPVRMVQKMKAPLTGGYTASIYIVSPYYDYSLVRWPIVITLKTNP